MPEELDRFAMLGKDARFNSKTGNKDAALMDPTNWFQSIRDGNTGQIRKLLTTGQDPESKTREGATGLMIASQSGTRSVLRLLIAHDAKLNACDHQGLYPLHYAVLSGQTKIAKYLVKHGASVKIKAPNSGNSLLLDACEQGHLELCYWLLVDHSLDYKATNYLGHSALALASQQGHSDIVQLLLEHQEAEELLEQTGEDDLTPLMQACHRGHLKVAKLLIKKGSQVNAKDSNGNTPLLLACSQHHLEVIKLLLKHKARVESQTELGATSLMFCAQAGIDEAVQRIIEKGASLDTQEVNGNTALILASQNNHVSTARLLLKSGADLDNLVDVAGKSALAIALANGNLELVKLFLEERQANFECPSHFIGVNMACLNGQIEVLKAVIGQVDLAKRDGKAGNYTPLHYACQTAHIEVVALLLDHGADVNARADQDLTPLMVACALGHPVVVDLLLHRGADPSIKDSTQSTALNAACLSGRTDIVKLFLLNQNLKLNNIQESHVWLGSAAFSGSLELVKFFLEEIGFKLDNSPGEHRSPLVQAAGQGHAQIVQYLIDKEADINSQGNPGKTTALIGACEMGQMETARMLIENGASLELVAENGLNAIQSACLNGQQQVLKYLVNQGADWRVKLEEDGSTLLHLACQSESHAILETCQYLVEKLELNVNARDKQGATPLILGVATKKGKELIELFIEQGADLEAVSKSGMTAVMEASATGQLEILKLLVTHGAKIGGDGCSQDYHPFIQAVRFGKLEVINYFISEHKVDLDMVVNGGLTALMVAITEEQFEMAKQLIEAACDVNIISDSKDTALTLTVRAEAEHLGLLSLLIDSGANMEHRIYHENMTALLIAVKDNKYETAKLLLEKGCNVNASDSTGATSLMYALLDQDLEIVKQLMRHGARQMVNQSMQLTALMIASALDNSDIVRYLLEQNGNVHARNPEGWTALMFATKAGKTANAKLLIRHKANVDSRDKGRETALVKACVKGDLEMVKVLIEDGKAQTDTLIAELFEQEILNDPQYQGIQNYLEQRRILNKETKDKCTIQ